MINMTIYYEITNETSDTTLLIIITVINCNKNCKGLNQILRIHFHNVYHCEDVQANRNEHAKPNG